MDLNLCNFFFVVEETLLNNPFSSIFCSQIFFCETKNPAFESVFLISSSLLEYFLTPSYILLIFSYPLVLSFFTFVSPHQSNNPNILFFVCLFSLFFSSTFASFFLKSPEQFNMFLELQEKLIN